MFEDLLDDIGEQKYYFNKIAILLNTFKNLDGRYARVCIKKTYVNFPYITYTYENTTYSTNEIGFIRIFADFSTQQIHIGINDTIVRNHTMSYSSSLEMYNVIKGRLDCNSTVYRALRLLNSIEAENV